MSRDINGPAKSEAESRPTSSSGNMAIDKHKYLLVVNDKPAVQRSKRKSPPQVITLIPPLWSRALNTDHQRLQLFILRRDEAPTRINGPSPRLSVTVRWSASASAHIQSWGSAAWFKWLLEFIVSLLRSKGLPVTSGGLWV